MHRRHPPSPRPLTRPDDWHLHLRDGAALASVVRRTGERVRACNCHAEPEAAGHDGRSRAHAYRERDRRRTGAARG